MPWTLETLQIFQTFVTYLGHLKIFKIFEPFVTYLGHLKYLEC